MQEIIGLIASVVIGIVVVLTLAVVQWRGQHTSIDATQFVAAKTGVLDFADMVEEDISNLGAGISAADMNNGTATPTNAGGFVLGGFDTSATTRFVEFYTWADTTSDFADAPPAPPAYPVDYDPFVVRYEWTASGQTVRVYDPTTGTYEVVPTYLVERSVNGAAAGESVNTVTQFRFDLFDIDGTEVTPANLADVRQIEVTLMVVSPLGGGTERMVDDEIGLAPAVSESRWNKVFRPPNLARPSP